ncbi:MAG: DMT family transporter, partial [Gemmatimonadales bacterium]
MSEPPSPRAVLVAYLQVVLAGTLWATSGPFSIAFFRMGIPPESVAILRPASGTVFILLLVLWKAPGGLRLPRRLWLPVLGFGGLVVGVFQLAYQMSTERVGVAATVALLYLAPAWVVACSRFLFGELLSPARVGLALLSVAGVWLTVFGARGVDVDLTVAGILWGCLCGITYGTYAMFGKYWGPSMGALAPLFWSTVGGTALLSLAWAVRGEAVVLPHTPGGWGLLGVFGFLTMAAAPLLLFNAMKTLEAGRAAIGTTVEAFVAALLALVL